MCGIAGWIDWTGAQQSPELLPKMTNRLRHRGPDGEGFYEDELAHLGHRRLSVIDLASGDQPIANEDETIWVVFNGEIYNFQELRPDLEKRGHRFRTQSDTEVIVHLYEEFGERGIEKLRGQFAIALWDSKAKRLFLARDRLGQKPLYYFRDQHRIVFASELKALMEHPAVPRGLNLTAVDLFFAYRYIPDPLSIFERVHKLPSAHFVLADRDSWRKESYWRAPFEDKLTIGVDDALDQLDELLEESVRLRMISDVPLGAFLSGGIDSSLVVAYMSRVSNQPVKTFCIGFEEETHDERKYARQVAERFGTDHQELVVRSNAIEILPRLVEAFDEPFADSSALAVYYLSKMTREEVTVALNGDGGDESFAGYRRHKGAAQMAQLRRLPDWGLNAVFGIGSLLAKTPLRTNSVIARMERWKNCSGESMADLYSRSLSAGRERFEPFYGPALRAYLAEKTRFDMVAEYYNQCLSGEAIDCVMHSDQQFYLPSDLLVKVDRMTMAHSLEGRSPFLDHKLVEFAARLPANVKFRGGDQKYLLKRLLERFFPRSFVRRKKMGFGVPVGEWIRTDLRPMVEDCIHNSHLVESGILDSKGLKAHFAKHLSHEGNFGADFWAFLTFEMWYRSHRSAESCAG